MVLEDSYPLPHSDQGGSSQFRSFITLLLGR